MTDQNSATVLNLDEELQQLQAKRLERIRGRHRCRRDFECRRKIGKATRHRVRLQQITHHQGDTMTTTTETPIGVLLYNLASTLNELDQRGAGPDHYTQIECEHAYLRYEVDPDTGHDGRWIAVYYSEVDPE